MGSHPSHSETHQNTICTANHPLQSPTHPSLHPQHSQQTLPLDDSDLTFLSSLIKKHCLFSIFDADSQNACLGLFTKRIYHQATYIYRQHDLPEQLFIISQGRLSVEIDCLILKSLQKHSYFGHDTLCLDSPRSQSIRVISKQATIFSLHKDPLSPFIKQVMHRHKQDISCIFNRIHFFNYLNNKQRSFMMQNTTLFRFIKGDVLFQKEQDANSFYIVRRGAVRIQIANQNDVIIREGEYFGQTAFLCLLNGTSKRQRMGRAMASDQQVQIYAIGMNRVKKCLDNYVRSIIFFNQEKWALYRDQYLSSLCQIDYNYLLQLFRVREGAKYTKLAQKNTKPSHIFIPLQGEINASRSLKIYCSQFLRKENHNKLLNYDIILTQQGYYAYALIDQCKEVLSLHKNSVVTSELCIKLLRQPLYMNMTLTLKNISKCGRKIDSVNCCTTVLVVEDMKFGNQFVVKIYKKETAKQSISSPILNPSSQNRKFKEIESLKCVGEQTQEQSQIQKPKIQHFYPDPIEQKYRTRPQIKTVVSEQRIKNERFLLGTLCNKYICGYYKSQHDNQNYYLFLEYINGLTLEQILHQFGTLPPSLAKFYLASLASALHYLHSQNVIYRNLGSRNVIINLNGYLRLVDLSCAKKIQACTRTTTLIGNPYYSAPEIIKGQGYQFSVDIWAMGVMLYEMITGKVPFGQGLSDPIDIYQRILQDQLNLKRVGHKKETAILSALLQKEPRKRLAKPLQIRKLSYIDDLQFQWAKFEKQELEPPYYPKQNGKFYSRVNNYEYFDAISIEDWI